MLNGSSPWIAHLSPRAAWQQVLSANRRTFDPGSAGVYYAPRREAVHAWAYSSWNTHWEPPDASNASKASKAVDASDASDVSDL
jgi:hypothetical protein